MTVMIIVTAPIAGHVAQRIGHEDPDDLRAHDGVGRPARPDVDHAHHAVLDDPDPVRDDGTRPRRDDGPDDGRRDGVGRSAASRPRLGDDQHEPRGGWRRWASRSWGRCCSTGSVPRCSRSSRSSGSRPVRRPRSRRPPLTASSPPPSSPASGSRPEQISGFGTAFQESYMSGFHLALLIAALVLLTAAVVANRFIPGRAHADEIHAARGRAGTGVRAGRLAKPYHPTVMALRILAVVGGTLLVIAAIGSAVKTVVLPRATALADHAIGLPAPPMALPGCPPTVDGLSPPRSMLGAYGPLALMAALATWLTLVADRLHPDLLGHGGSGLAGGVRPVGILAVHARLLPAGRPRQHRARSSSRRRSVCSSWRCWSRTSRASTRRSLVGRWGSRPSRSARAHHRRPRR